MPSFTRLPSTDTGTSSPTLDSAWGWLGMGLTGLALCAGAYWVGATVIQPWWNAQEARSTEAVTFVPPTVMPAAAAPIEPRPAAAAPSVRASLVMDGRELARIGDRVALPSGARFQVALHAQRSGMVRLEAVNPDGTATLVWSTNLDTGERALSPMLRLTGTRGMKNLRVVSANGQVQRFAILHV